MSKSSKDPCETLPEALGASGLVMRELTLFEKSRPGRSAYSFAALDVPETATSVEPEMLRDRPELPELSEVDVARHYFRLSQWNFCIESGLYPLGSCTMKYNPKVNEVTSRLAGFTQLHPGTPEKFSQGALELQYELALMLAEISGLDSVSLQPAAGAQGEMTGMLMIRAYHESRNDRRTKVLIPDTAHGTNPASSTVADYKVVQLKSNERGVIDLDDLAEKMDEQVAAIMVTNPNTLGLFEENICEATKLVHERGGLVYCDGANMNAIMGQAKPGDFGADVLHINLHKTFSTPHGGGGPGSGPVAVRDILDPFLPGPIVVKCDYGYGLDHDRPQSIGKVQWHLGNFGVLVRAYTYIREMGASGLEQASKMAVLNANYVRQSLKESYHLAFDRTCMHECVFSDKSMPNEVSTLDVAKRLMDYGFHPPTVYFPLVVKGAIMVEPPETESKEEVDRFIASMIEIRNESEQSPDIVKGAPHKTRVRRLDEVRAARQLELTYKD
jgi:glycine cleavage system P protein (glycine dehydrogenase) subunit 2